MTRALQRSANETRSVRVHLVAANGEKRELPALTASLRLDTGILQMLPPGASDFVSFDHAGLELCMEGGEIHFDLTEGFASFGKGALTVMVRCFQEMTA